MQAQIANFRAQVNASQALQSEVRAAYAQGIDAVILLGKKHGLDVTADDLIELAGQGELSDFELELVAGGAPIRCTTSTDGKNA